jgi:hypothetical protein
MKMTKTKRRLLVLGALVAVCALPIVLYGCNLGRKATAAADVYLAKHAAELNDICQGPYEVTVGSLFSLRWRIGWYYYCWTVDVPCSLKAESGQTYTVVVHTWDGIQPNTHDTDHFRALRMKVIDMRGRTIREYDR